MIKTYINEFCIQNFGLLVSERKISPPQPVIKMIDIPYSNKKIDLTESMGFINYEYRNIELTLTRLEEHEKHQHELNPFFKMLHAKKVKIFFEDDMGYFYTGRSIINDIEIDKIMLDMKMRFEVEPFKYEMSKKKMIKEVNENLKVEVKGYEQAVIPTINCSEDMMLKYDNSNFNLKKGENENNFIYLKNGTNKFEFIGNGKITMEYRGCHL